MTERAEIDAALESAVANFLSEMGNRKPIHGWKILLQIGYHIEQVGSAHIPVMSDENLAALVKLAGANPYAHDGARYLAAQLVAVGRVIPMPLRLFAGQLLAGEIRRPRQVGRPPGDDALMVAWQYSLAMFTHRNGGVPLGRSTDQKPTAEISFSACDAVAEAFTKCGRRLTYEKMKSICYDASYADVRRLGEWLDSEKEESYPPFIRFRR